jgi:hypothetical protein
MSNNSSRKLPINIEISGTECVTFGAEFLAIAGLAVQVILVLGHVGAVHHLLAKSWLTSHEKTGNKKVMEMTIGDRKNCLKDHYRTRSTSCDTTCPRRSSPRQSTPAMTIVEDDNSADRDAHEVRNNKR